MKLRALRKDDWGNVSALRFRDYNFKILDVKVFEHAIGKIPFPVQVLVKGDKGELDILKYCISGKYLKRKRSKFDIVISTECTPSVIDISPKTIKDLSCYKLTNLDISQNYSKSKFYLSLYDFKGAFAYWATVQNNNGTYGIVSDAIQAYTKFLQSLCFVTKDTIIEMDFELIKNLTKEDIFVNIPEILALNQMKPDFIDLGALSRNVFYHILRQSITQPL